MGGGGTPVAPPVSPYKFFAYDLLTGSPDPTRDFDVREYPESYPNADPTRGWLQYVGGVWFDGTTAFMLTGATAESGPATWRALAFDPQTRSRVPDRDIELHGTHETNPYYQTGLWSNGSTIWTIGYARDEGQWKRRVLAFDVESGAYTPDRNIDLEVIARSGVVDIWSDGTTMWVLVPVYLEASDEPEYRLYAFNVATGTRNPARDIEIEGMELIRPNSFWSNGSTLWISNDDGRLLAYDVGGDGAGGGFTDPGLITGETSIKALHMRELRQRVNALRRRHGLPPFTWTDPAIVPGVTAVKAVHFRELRTALNQAYAAAGRNPPGYPEGLRAGVTPIRAVHIEELRRAVLLLE